MAMDHLRISNDDGLAEIGPNISYEMPLLERHAQVCYSVRMLQQAYHLPTNIYRKQIVAFSKVIYSYVYLYSRHSWISTNTYLAMKAVKY